MANTICSLAIVGSQKMRLMAKLKWSSTQVKYLILKNVLISHCIICEDHWLCLYLYICLFKIRISTPSLYFHTVINYEVTVVTGDVWAGGTNANVVIQIYGEEGKTELITLKSRSNNFERGTTNIFKVMSNIYGFSHTLSHTLLLPIV